MEDEEPYVSVKKLLKEFGEKPAMSTNDDDYDNTFRSVKDRMRVFDSRQDNNVCGSDNNVSAHHNARDSAPTSSRNRFSSVRSPGSNSKSVSLHSTASNMSRPPLSASHSETERSNRSSSSLKENSPATEVFKYGNVTLKKVEKPGEARWKTKSFSPSRQGQGKPEIDVGTGLKTACIPPAFAAMNLRSTGTPRVSDRAKTFSTQIKLAENGERAEEEKVIGRVARTASGVHEIVHIRSTLKSSATELEELRKSLNSCTPVAKLIAERNRAAEANRPDNRNVVGCTDDKRILYGRTRSKSVGRAPNSHRRTKSMSSNQNSGTNGDSDQVRRDSVGTLESFSNLCWDDFKANNPTEGAINTIWDMNLDQISLFGGPKSCTALDTISGGYKGKLLPSNSTISETDSDGDYYDNYGHSSYIQITLSSGGIVEKCEPVICMTMTDDSSAEYQSEYGDMYIDPTSDAKHSTRKALKGAKKFFFGGKNKKKSAPVEV